MQKITKIALATGALFSAGASAAIDSKLLTVYGRADVSAVLVDENDETMTDIVSNASRVGVKGEYELDGGLTAIYKYEFQVNIDDKEDNMTARNQYLGVKGNFGQVVLGRIDTALKKSQGKIDLFSDNQGDIKKIWKGENRLEDTIAYKSPSLNGFRINVNYIAEAGGKQDEEHGVSAAITYGDAKLKKTGFYAALAADSEVAGYDIVRLAGQAKFGDLKLGAIVQQQEKVDGGADTDGAMVSAAYKISKATIKFQYQLADEDGGAEKTQATLGLDYKLGKSTKAYTFYTSRDNDDIKPDESYFGVGLQHKF